MSKKDINAAELITAQKNANRESEKIIRVLGLDDMVIRNNKVIKIHPDGSEQVVQDSRFKSVRTNKGTFQIKK